ncbi:MBOAT family O-acyltransferase [Saccharicrinis sp. FJH2]|uniref:MBOAT family O-acyltransferase n=1 Tax=Saccharicrinis sp. FJH65 TaxID=3344659 RepID=UPI0035F4C66B
MLFNSIEFAIFLPLVFLLYWFIFNKKLKVQNAFLVVVSYIFYGWWDWRFLSLIAFSSLVDYLVGIGLGRTEDVSKRKGLLLLSIFVNLGFLGFFKYFNFFSQGFADAFTLLGYKFNPFQLNIILPVGISFYTFQTLSYSIDVYKKKLQPTKDIVAFFAYVSFFPQLVAGPIERATNLLPQFQSFRRFDVESAKDGLRQILWGLFKKIVIADNCARFVNDIFGNYQDHSGSTLLVAAIFFAFQIYGDFSGYSDIAIGTARLFGFSLMRNFAYPYFSRDIAEFWRRWHISLSTWFRDYVYIPLGGSRGSKWQQVRNTFIIFIVSGFWHGANWTFITWGALNAIFFLPLLLFKQNRKHLDMPGKHTLLPLPGEFFSMLLTFTLTTLAWIFFRAESMSMAFDYINKIFSISLFTMPELQKKTLFFLLFLLGIEWLQRSKQHGLQLDTISTVFKYRTIRWLTYYTLVFAIIIFGAERQEFIYFQF